MIAITDMQFAAARKLVDARRQRIAEVTTLRTQAADTLDRAERAFQFFNERLNFNLTPGRLDGLAELLQRNPSYEHRIVFSYRAFLARMIDPLPLVPGGARPDPHRVDFHALPPGARPYLLGPFLNIHAADRFAEVCLSQSRPSEGKIVMVQTGGPVSGDAWRAHMPAISAWLGEGWTFAGHKASTVLLIRRPPLPASIPFNRRYLKRGALFAGIATDTRQPLHIPFTELSAGTFVCGASGSGKTSAFHVLLRSIFANLDLFAAVHLVDGKDGVAMARYAGLHPKIHVHYDEPDVWKLIADLNDVMRERNAAQRAAGVDKATKDFIAVVIDELPTFIAKPPGDGKKDHAMFLDQLNRIAMRGRSAGIRMLFITQSPVAEQIPVTLRANCATTLAFRLPEPAHATALFGTLTAENDPRKLPTGQARLLQAESGQLDTVQLPFAPLWNGRRL